MGEMGEEEGDGEDREEQADQMGRREGIYPNSGLLNSLFPIPYSLFPVPCSLFPVPCSLFPTYPSTEITLDRYLQILGDGLEFFGGGLHLAHCGGGLFGP